MRQLIVFSLDLIGKPATADDVAVSIGLLRQSGIIVRDALGVYNGTSERAFIAEINHKGEAALVKTLAMQFQQECILLIDAYHVATLIYFDGTPNKILGHWIKTNLIDKQNMTIDLTEMQGYVVR